MEIFSVNAQEIRDQYVKEYNEHLTTLEFPVLSDKKKNRIAKLVYNAFLKGFQKRFKYIESLKDARIYEDAALLKFNKSGWYGWINIDMSNFSRTEIKSFDFGCSFDIDQIISPEDMKEIAKMVMNMDKKPLCKECICPDYIYIAQGCCCGKGN
jgi:hypothetical protein